MKAFESKNNFFHLSAAAAGVLLIGLFMSFVPQSLAEALDAPHDPYLVPTKSKDENKETNKAKDEKKVQLESLAVEPSPLARVEESASKEKEPAKEKDVKKKPDPEPSTPPAGPLTTANPEADANTKAILAYIAGLKAKSADKVISGQFIGHPAKPGTTYFEENYEDLVTGLEQLTGESIGMVGADYAQLTDENPVIDLELTNEPLIDHWNDGGLVTVSWHSRNPWNGKDARDTAVKGKFSDILKPGTPANKAWMEELDVIADGLLDLQEAGVTVLWRPLHESNGNAFWWSKAGSSDFKALWKQMFVYLTEEKGLNNLLWVYSVVPKLKSSDGRRGEEVNYPGSEYVDITGLDIYAPELDEMVPSYKKMLKFGKPFGLTEYGPYKGSDAKKNPSLELPHFNYDHLADEIRANMPEAAFFQAWNHGHSMAHQLNAAGLLKDPWITDATDWN